MVVETRRCHKLAAAQPAWMFRLFSLHLVEGKLGNVFRLQPQCLTLIVPCPYQELAGLGACRRWYHSNQLTKFHLATKCFVGRTKDDGDWADQYSFHSLQPLAFRNSNVNIKGHVLELEADVDSPFEIRQEHWHLSATWKAYLRTSSALPLDSTS